MEMLVESRLRTTMETPLMKVVEYAVNYEVWDDMWLEFVLSNPTWNRATALIEEYGID